MKLTYNTLAKVVILNDYYLTGATGDNESIWYPGYSVWNDLRIFPTAETQRTLRDYRLLFKPTNDGFSLLATTLPSELSSGDRRTTVFLDQNIKFTFFIALSNPNFVNFTNLRLDNFNQHIFYFHNLTGNDINYNVSENGGTISIQKLFLSQTLLPHQNTQDYLLGDLIFDGTNVLEAVTANSGAFQSSNWEDVDENIDARYVSQRDRKLKQGPIFSYQQPNSFAASNTTVGFELKDAALNQSIQLNHGNLIQDHVRYPSSPLEDLNARLFLSHIPPGCYELTISDPSAPSTAEFFLIDPIQYPSVFGAIELVARSPLDDFQFVEYQSDAVRVESILRPRRFEIRFKNRTTVWEYYNKAGNRITITPAPGRRPLTKNYSAFTANSILLPDPPVDLIYPGDSDDSLYSRIYLNDSINI